MKCKLLETIFKVIKDKNCKPDKVFSLIEEMRVLEEMGGCR
jgi:hypothetical protein